MVSVVIPARNAADLLPIQLAALERQDYEHDWEVIIVDNGSTDGTAETALTWKGRLALTVISAGDTRGVSHARNIGARSSRGDLIAFCDADDEVSEGWLTAIVEASVDSDAVGGAIDSTRFSGPTDSALYSIERSTNLRLAGGFLPAASGCNIAVWSDVFASLGGFDECYVDGAEDVEFCWRLQLAGYELGYSPQALIHYRTRNSLRSLARQFYFYGRGNSRLYRDYRSAGMPRSSIWGAFKGWVWLIVHCPDLLRDPQRRGMWARLAGMRLGKAIASVRNRTIYL